MSPEDAPSAAVPATTERPKKRRRRYNWTRIKAEYVEGITGDDGKVRFPTFAEVAERNNALSQNLRTRAAREGWTDQRATFQRRVEAQRQNERSTELAALGADLDVSALRLARSGMAVTALRMQELSEDARKRAEALRQTGGRQTATTPPPADTEEINALALAAGRYYDLGLKALGDAPERAQLDVHVSGGLDSTLEVGVHTDAGLAVGLTSILMEAGVIQHGADRGDVLDVESRPAGELPPAPDAQDEPVHPPDADDESEPEPEATGVPATRSA